RWNARQAAPAAAAQEAKENRLDLIVARVRSRDPIGVDLARDARERGVACFAQRFFARRRGIARDPFEARPELDGGGTNERRFESSGDAKPVVDVNCSEVECDALA